MGLMSNIYNGAVDLYGQAIYHGLKTTGWSDQDIIKDPIINRMADHGEIIDESYNNGEIIKGSLYNAYGLTDSAIFAATHTPEGEGWMNNLICAGIGGITGAAAGYIIGGSIAGSVSFGLLSGIGANFGAAVGAAALGGAGYMMGDTIMWALDQNFEKTQSTATTTKPTALTPEIA